MTIAKGIDLGTLDDLVEGFRDPAAARVITAEIAVLGASLEAKGIEPRLMEVCGSHTVAIFRSGIRDLLPSNVKLISGPGCPVCVTSVAEVDRAIAIANTPGTILTTFGDMMRVPGTSTSLEKEKAEGADVRVVYSPLDALNLAAEKQATGGDERIVFFAAGFETTAPTVAAAILQAADMGLSNFYIQSTHKTIPSAMRGLLDTPELGLSGFICPGHVSAIIGARAYDFIADEFKVPAVVSGFEPLDILMSVKMLLAQIDEGRAEVETEYGRIVSDEGNPRAIEVLDQVFRVSDAEWRGIGTLPNTGLVLRSEYERFDAPLAFDVRVEPGRDNPACECGEILRGLKAPTDCKLFAGVCTPENPQGACMVSTEGSCAAYYKYGRDES